MKWIFPLLLATLYCFCFTTYADDTVHRTKSWNNVTITGPLGNDKSLKYFLESQLRLVDVDNKFENIFCEAGLGYQTSPNLIFWFGFRLGAANDYQGNIEKRTLLWQQINNDFYKTNHIKITGRTRLEEVQVFEEHEVSLIFRQRLTIETPIDSAAKYAIVAYDTIFIQVNHPDWVTNKLLNQNRFYVGLKYSIDSVHSINCGYLHQLQFNDPDVMNNIIVLQLNINYDSPNLDRP